MKSLSKNLTCFLILMILVQVAYSGKNFLRASTQSELEQEYDSIWKTMFSGSRGQSCQGAAVQKAVEAAAIAAAEQVEIKGEKAKPGKFAWLKNWGYGPLAYVFDFMDPAIRGDVLKEFKSIYGDMRKYSPLDTPEYQDAFDLKKLLANSKDQKMNEKALADLTLLNKNYDPKIYDISVNTVQLRQAMMEWKWAGDFAQSDFAKMFVKKYDINGDGRLNPRELILGALDHNKHLFGTPSCTHCFENVSNKIDAIFSYIDCDNDGIITAEDLWNNLPKLKRASPQFNMFALGADAGVRTSSVNDFVLTNMNSQSGSLNKIEFRNAILFGIWDRQTDFYKIIEDDSRTLKELRWKDDNMVDIKAEEYIKQLKLKELQAKNK